MSGLDLNRLENNEDEILKAEIGALLFNLGKTHIGFWRYYFPTIYDIYDNNHEILGFKAFSSYKNYYDHKDSLGKTPFEVELEKYHLRDFVFNKQVDLPFLQEKIEWQEFFKGDVSKEEFIQKIFFRGCENINSGIDKGSPRNDQQIKLRLWLSKAFGSFKRLIEEKDFDKRRSCFYQNLYDFLDKKNYFQDPNWQDIRDFIIREIKSWYSNLLSDSRFPVNDVSLWDQAYMTASMFKAVLSQLILENCQQIGNHNYFKNPSSIRWRILGIQYDKLGLSEKGYKLASIKWYRKTIEEIDEEIKKILEVEYPIGNEIYRDETGIYFIVGEDLGKDNGEFAYLDEDLKNIENKIVEVFKNKLEGEICPTILMTKASRGLMNLGFLLEKAKENFLKKKVINNELELNINKAIGICPLCKIRLIYEEDKQKNNSPTICKTCNERVHHKVVETWLDNLNGETIWTSEIKDSQNRIALISLKFELKDWLNGNLLNSLVMREEDYEKYKNDIKLFIILFLTNIDLKKILLEEKAKALEIKLKNIEIKLKERNLDSKEKERLIKQKKSLVPIKILTDKLTKLIEEIRNEHWYKKNLSENLQQIQGYTNTFDELISEINIKVNEINDIESTVLKIKQIINPFEKLSPEAYNGCKNNNETFDDYIRQIFFGSIIGTPWEDWIRDNDILNNEINWQEEKIEWDKITDENDPALDLLATLLLQLLLRKNPSPARLRRIWETTEEFFEDIKKDIYIS